MSGVYNTACPSPYVLADFFNSDEGFAHASGQNGELLSFDPTLPRPLYVLAILVGKSLDGANFFRPGNKMGRWLVYDCMQLGGHEDDYWFEYPERWEGIPPVLWDRIKDLANRPPTKRRRKAHRKGGRPRLDDRLTFSALLWMLRAGKTWRDVPKRFGSARTIRRRLSLWLRSCRMEWLFRAYLGVISEREVLRWSRVFQMGRWRRSDFRGHVFENTYRYDDRAQRLALKYSKIEE